MTNIAIDEQELLRAGDVVRSITAMGNAQKDDLSHIIRARTPMISGNKVTSPINKHSFPSLRYCGVFVYMYRQLFFKHMLARLLKAYIWCGQKSTTLELSLFVIFDP